MLLPLQGVMERWVILPRNRKADLQFVLNHLDLWTTSRITAHIVSKLSRATVHEDSSWATPKVLLEMVHILA
jgi:hypothetical protein